jgi:hypothetical protein
MEAPEKIYFSATENGTHYYTEGIPFQRECIEYTRTDVFIEKACEWLKSNLYDYAGEDDKRNIVPFDSSIFEDFKNYMKGE